MRKTDPYIRISQETWTFKQRV